MKASSATRLAQLRQKRQHERHGKWKTAHMHREGNRNHLCILSIPFMQCMSMSRLSHNVLPSAQESPERRSTGLNSRSRWINDGSTDQPSRRKTMKNLQSPRNSTGKPATKAPKALALCGQRIHKRNSKLLESQGLVNES